MSDGGLSDTLTGAGAVLGTGGIIGAVKWFFKRRDGHVQRIERELKEVREELAQLWLAFSWVTAELHVHQPDSPALKMAGKILRDKFPLDLSTPPDLRDLMAKLK